MRNYLRGETLVGAVGEQKAHNGVVVFLGRHVQRGEAVLALDVDGGAMLNQQSYHLFLTSCKITTTLLLWKINPLPPSDADRKEKKIFRRIFCVQHCHN